MSAGSAKTSPRSAAPAADRVVRSLVRAFGLLDRAMQPYFSGFGISGSQWGVLRNLHRAAEEGSPALRLTDLGRRLLIRPPSVTGLVGRLEQAGLVARTGGPDDLRTKLVSLTPRGRALVERILVEHPARMKALLGGLRRVEQASLHRLLERFADHVEGLLEQPVDGETEPAPA